MPNFYFETYHLPQVPDSTRVENSGFSFEKSSQEATGKENSFLSTDFQNQKIDSLVRVKTKRLRVVKKKKPIKAHKIIDSDLIIKKDTFLFLKGFQNKAVSLSNLDHYYKPLASYKKNILPPTPSVKGHSEKETNDSHLVKPSCLSTKEHYNLRSEWWLIIVLLLVLFYSAFIKLKFNNRLKPYPISLLTYQYFQKLFRGQNALDIRLSQLLKVLFLINVSLLIFYANLEFSWVYSERHHFLISLFILGAIISYHLAFAFINKILAFIFEAPLIINEYLHNMLFINNVFGIIALPFVIVYPFLDTPLNRFVLYIVLGMYAFMYLLRWWRGFQISFKNNVPIFYLILYLCALEITLVILIYKLIFI